MSMSNYIPAVDDQVVHQSGATGTVLAVFPDESIAKVHFPDGITTTPGGAVTATEWHVRFYTLAPA
jgi:hypothetical protein